MCLGLETIHVWSLQPDLQHPVQTTPAHGRTHRREEVQVRPLWPKVYPVGGAKPTQEHRTRSSQQTLLSLYF